MCKIQLAMLLIRRPSLLLSLPDRSRRKHVPWKLLTEAGADYSLAMGGMHALDSCRIEKKFVHFGHDIGDEDTPLEAGMGFVCKLDKPGGFIGRDALAKLKSEGTPKRRMLQFLLSDPEPLLHANETIYLDGKAVGHIQVGAYGHTLGGATGIGFAEHDAPLTADIVASGTWEIDIAGTRVAATASLKPLFDPGMERIRR